MEAKLFSIILCLLVSEATGSVLENVTSVQHRTENASTRSMVANSPNKPINRPTVYKFDYRIYARKIFVSIKRHIRTSDQESQFAFIMFAHSPHKRFEVPGSVQEVLNGQGKLPDLKTKAVFPPSADSNLVIAGVTYSGKPYGLEDLPYHAEQKLIAKMPTMSRYDSREYNRICPWLIVLGSNFDTCFNKKQYKGLDLCANRFIIEKRKFVRQTPCKKTLWLVYVWKVRKPHYWKQAVPAYRKAGIMVKYDYILVTSKKKPMIPRNPMIPNKPINLKKPD